MIATQSLRGLLASIILLLVCGPLSACKQCREPHDAWAGLGGPVSYPAGKELESVALGDLDSDGDLDMVSASYKAPYLVIYLNKGDGSFQRAGADPAGASDALIDVAIDDLDGDGRKDVIAVNGVKNRLSFFRNTGGATLAAPTYLTVGTKPNTVVIADLGGGEALDLAVANELDHSVSILLNKGDGTFSEAHTVKVGKSPETVTAGHLNADRRVDLAVANEKDNTLSVLFNLGQGKFKPSKAYAVGPEPESIAVGDLNGDGVADLASASFGDGEVGVISVLLNRGGETFKPATAYPSGVGSGRVVLADLNGDGHLDMVGGNYDEATLSALLNNGDGTFRPARKFKTGRGPGRLRSGDLDGDGDADLVAANFHTHNLDVHLNKHKAAK